MLATDGNLVFQGTADGRFVAYRADTGERMWERAVGTGVIAAPVSYEVDGRQYVAVIEPGGTSGSSSHVGQLNARSPIGPRGVGHTMFVFALPEQ